jgi:uncharacterized tellurite resistance protein B-like protein
MVLEGIRSFFTSKVSREREAAGPDPVAIAACALLLEIAHADTFFGAEERERILKHAREELKISEVDLAEVIRLAEEERRESVDLYQFTRLIVENFSREQRLRLIEAIWGVVYSDGLLSASESQLARRIAELLGFQHPEVQALKDKIADRNR